MTFSLRLVLIPDFSVLLLEPQPLSPSLRSLIPKPRMGSSSPHPSYGHLHRVPLYRSLHSVGSLMVAPLPAPFPPTRSAHLPSAGPLPPP